MEYKWGFGDKVVSERKIHNYISQCRNISDVRYFLQRKLFIVEKSEPPFGELRKEHLIKALEIAEEIGDKNSCSKIFSNIHPVIGKNWLVN